MDDKKELRSTPKWISVKEGKPDNDCIVYVMNERAGMCGFLAFYRPREDVFIQPNEPLYNTPCMDVTHWYPLP